MNAKAKIDEDKLKSMNDRDPPFEERLYDDEDGESESASGAEKEQPPDIERRKSPERLVRTLTTVENSPSEEALSYPHKSELVIFMDTVHKWNFEYGENKKPTEGVHFLESISLDDLLKARLELFEDAPPEWFQNNTNKFKCFTDRGGDTSLKFCTMIESLVDS